MFKNPIKKYQSGGVAPSQEEQQMLQAFIEWLPKRVKEFANMQPEQIVEALNGMGKTPEGQKQVQAYMQQFQQELKGQQAGMFKDGGKLHDFICKHAKGGHIAGCDCKEDGGNIESAANGEKLSKKEALAQSQETHGFNAAQARKAYANAKNALRKSGLRGEALRQAAREMIARSNAQNNGIEAVQSVEPIQTLMQVPQEQLVAPATVIKPNYDHMSFSNAFKAAASMADNGGDKTFTWKGKEYGTKRAPVVKSETKPETKPETQQESIVAPSIEDVVIETPEIEVPTFEKIPVNNAPMQTWAQQKYPMNVDYYIVDPTFWGSDLVKNPSVEDSFARVYKPKSISTAAPISINLPENYESSGSSYEYYPRVVVKTSVGEGAYSLSEPGVREKLNEKEQKTIKSTEKMPSMRFARWNYEPIRAKLIPSLVYSQKKGGEVEKAQNGTSGIPQNASALDTYLMSNMQMPTSDSLFTGQQVANLINSIHLNQPLVQAQEDGGKVEKAEEGIQKVPSKSPRPGNINVPTIAGILAEIKQRKAADSGNATNRNFSKVNWGGNQYFLERANIDGNTVDTWVQVTPNLDTLVQQQLPSGRYTPLTQEQAQSIVNRNRADINKQEDGGVVKEQNLPTESKTSPNWTKKSKGAAKGQK